MFIIVYSIHSFQYYLIDFCGSPLPFIIGISPTMAKQLDKLDIQMEEVSICTSIMCPLCPYCHYYLPLTSTVYMHALVVKEL